MNINSDGAEIDAARDMEVYGDWIRFVDGEGAIVKIDPEVVKQLMGFVTANKVEISETPAPISNLQIRDYLERLKERIVKRYVGSPSDRDIGYGMEIVYFDLLDLLNGREV
jgi:hypothetical protein